VGLTQEIPAELLIETEKLLIVPCWQWTKTSEYGFGPPIIITTDSLDELPEIVPRWRGFEVVDLFGHEGSEAPHSCGVLIITDTGRALRSQYRYQFPAQGEKAGKWLWQGTRTALVGQKIRSGMLDLVASQELDSSTVTLLFDKPYGKVIPNNNDSKEGLEFLSKLPVVGDDVWAAIDALVKRHR
jgi:hypothetical protein